MKTEEIVQRLRDNARQHCPPKFPVERMVVWIAADALAAQAAEIERLRELAEMVETHPWTPVSLSTRIRHALIPESP